MLPLHPLSLLALVAALFAPPAPATSTPTSTRAANPRIAVNDFGVNDRVYELNQTPYIRRGGVTKVRIYKHYIDLVPNGQVSIVGGGNITSIANGVVDDIGFKEVSLDLSAGLTTGTTITLKIGLVDQFPLRVVHRGEVSSITQVALPSTIQAGTAFTLTLAGVDMGGLRLASGSPQCHVITPGANNSTTKAFTLTRNATCAATQHSVFLDNTDSKDPDHYLRSNGSNFTHTFTYAPPPPQLAEGLVCTSVPSIGAPVIRAPITGQQFVFGPATASPVSVEVRWDSLTAAGVRAPLNEFDVSMRPAGGTQIASLAGSISGTRATVERLVRGFRTTFSVTLPDSVTISVRARNCGQSAPAASVTIGVLRQ